MNTALSYLDKDPEANAAKVMALVDRLTPDSWYVPQRAAVRNAIETRNNWFQLVMKVWELDPGVRKAFFQNFVVNASLMGSAVQEEAAAREGCNVPWAILMDPTTACNLHCTGCWAAEYGNQLNLTLDEMSSIVEQGKRLGTYMYIFTGGEPLVRKKDVIALCERHPDCEFLSFTNGTLIDEAFCQEMLRVKNFIPALSVEGFEEANDSRRGEGVYDKVTHAMALLKQHHLPFGISACYTSVNYKDITSEKFYDLIMDLGAYFVWFFHYMPVGNDAAVELLPTPEQRKTVYERIRAYRKTKPIFIRNCRISFLVTAVISLWKSSKVISPLSACSRKLIQRRRVVFPEPLFPRTAITEPFSTLKSTPFNTSFVPNFLWIFFTSSIFFLTFLYRNLVIDNRVL